MGFQNEWNSIYQWMIKTRVERVSKNEWGSISEWIIIARVERASRTSGVLCLSG